MNALMPAFMEGEPPGKITSSMASRISCSVAPCSRAWRICFDIGLRLSGGQANAQGDDIEQFENLSRKGALPVHETIELLVMAAVKRIIPLGHELLLRENPAARGLYPLDLLFASGSIFASSKHDIKTWAAARIRRQSGSQTESTAPSV